MAQQLVGKHGGQVPADMEQLTALPGVGRKTANVVLGHALGVPGLPVDRHVLRVSNRIGIAEGDDPVKVESQLCSGCRRRCGRSPPTSRSCTGGGSAGRSRSARSARCATTAITIALGPAAAPGKGDPRRVRTARR